MSNPSINRRPMHKNRMQAGEKPKDFKKSMGKMIRYIGSYKFAVLLVMIFAIGSTIFNVIGPKILGKATTEVFQGLAAKIAGTGSIDYTNRPHSAVSAWPLCVERLPWFPSELPDVRNHAEGDLPHEKRTLREDQPHAIRLL